MQQIPGQDDLTARHPRLPCDERVLGGRYRVRRVIGRGEVADVYLGDDLLLERAVAIKIPHHSVVADASRLEQFRREAISLAGVRSPNIVNVYDMGADEDAYLIMQHIEGRTIEEEVRRFGAMPHARVAMVLTQLLAGLAAMHGQGLVHGDIRASNVLLARNGKVVLLDLGIVLDRRHADSVVGIGTPVDRVIHAPRAFTWDVYNVGQLILFMFTAIDGARRSHRAGFEDLFRRLPVPFAGLARRALDVDPTERFASASVMKTAVEIALELPTTSTSTADHVVKRERPTTTMTASHLLSLLTDAIPPAWNGAKTLGLAVPLPISAVPTESGRILVVEEDQQFGTSILQMLSPSYRVSIVHDARDAHVQLEAGARFNVILCGLANPVQFHRKLLATDPDQAAATVFLTGDNACRDVTAFLERVTNKRLARTFEAAQLRTLISLQIASARRAITSRG